MPSISKNSIYLFSGSAVQKILSFVYFIFLARYLGPESIGKYTFAIFFVLIFSVFIDCGLNQILIRQTARDQSKAKDYLSNILAVKLICAAIIYLIIILAVNLLGYPTITKNLVYLAALAMILSNLADTFYSVLRGFQSLKYESIGLIFYEFTILVIGFIVLYFRLPLLYVIFPLIFASIIYLLFGLIIVNKKYQIRPTPKLNLGMAKNLLKIAMPFFVASVFGVLFSYIDVVLLSKLGGDKFVGFYSAAGRIPSGLRIVPIAFAAALYPAACLYFEQNKDELRRVTEKAISYLILLCLPIIIGLWVFADQAIAILYGAKFIEAVSALRILSWSILFVFLDYIFFVILNACGQEKKNVLNRGLAMVAIIILNLICIPALKHIGSAWAFTFSFAFLAFLGSLASYRTIHFSVKRILLYFIQVLIVSLVMGFILIMLKSIVSLVPLILIGSVVYFVGLWIIGLIGREDIRYFKNLIGLAKINR